MKILFGGKEYEVEQNELGHWVDKDGRFFGAKDGLMPGASEVVKEEIEGEPI
jgi:hypothetical protein